jgi:hypothetical protein
MMPVLWKCVDMNLVSNRGWEGWMLTYLTTKVLPQKPLKSTRNNPFFTNKCTSERITELLSKYSTEEQPVSFRSFCNVFEGNDGVMVRNNCLPSRAELKVFQGKVIVIVFDVESSVPVVVKDQFSEWELRFIGVTHESLNVSNNNSWAGEIYVRHGKAHRGFWKVQKNRKMSKCTESASVLLNLLRATWDVLVFVKTKDTDFEALRKQMLELQDRQAKVYCKHHHLPLVITPRQQGHCKTCSLRIQPEGVNQRCHRKCFYLCPKGSCKLIVCRVHMRGLLTDTEEEVLLNLDGSHENPRDGEESEGEDIQSTIASSRTDSSQSYEDHTSSSDDDWDEWNNEEEYNVMLETESKAGSESVNSSFDSMDDDLPVMFRSKMEMI